LIDLVPKCIERDESRGAKKISWAKVWEADKNHDEPLLQRRGGGTAASGQNALRQKAQSMVMAFYRFVSSRHFFCR
jgi:molybdenum-dependent DNA-binding transcriptional regulator ModE